MNISKYFRIMEEERGIVKKAKPLQVSLRAFCELLIH